jgi:hypothetical protein
MRHTTCLIILLVAAALMAQTTIPTEPPPVNTAGISALVSRDKLQIRDIQLAMAQAHIARLQAEAQIKSLEAQLGQAIESLKVAYACQTCTLQSDFTWQKPEPPKAPATAASSPAPKKGGQTSAKE